MLPFAKMKDDSKSPMLAPPPLDVPNLSEHTLTPPEEWLARHGDYLYRYAVARVRNSTTAEDLVQETLLAALRAQDGYGKRAAERSWLTGILRHKILDHFRRLSRERRVFDDAALPSELEERFDELGSWRRDAGQAPADWGIDAAVMMQRKEFMAALKSCLSVLPQRCADAFVLREMEGVESARIQEMLGISAANFWVLLHRARMQLRLCLEKKWLHL